jgi:beta-glucosidase
MRFPDGFVFGVATAAYQIEGAAHEDGRMPSIWDTFARVPGKVHHGDTGDIASDHYHRLEHDLDLLATLGVTGYRFSVAWPRVLPEGRGAVNQKGLDFYKRLLDGLHERSIEPLVTIYHWDLPQALEDRGGWRRRDTAAHLADFAGLLAEELDGVARWVTLNEPWCSAFVGHLHGLHAPGLTDLTSALQAAHHLLLAHGLTVAALRSSRPAAQVGITLNLTDVHPAAPCHAEAASRIDGNENRWFLDPLFKGHYPKELLNWYLERADLSALRDEDLNTISQPIDFLGINYYERHVVVGDADDPVHGARKLVPEGPVTDAGIAVRADGLVNILRRVSSDYSGLPLYITENGAAYNDYATPEGTVDDLERVGYLRDHLAAVAECANEGIDVRGYYAWSFLDTFEWAQGYSRRFGLVSVDYPSQRRLIKASGRWYSDMIAAQG